LRLKYMERIEDINKARAMAGEDYERDKGRLERGQQQKKEQEKSKTSPETLSRVVEGLVESGNRLARVLEVRESQGLSPLIDPAEILRLRGVLAEVQNFHHTKNAEMLLQNLNTIASVVDKFGRAPATRMVKESNEGFNQTIVALKTMEANFRDSTLLVAEGDSQIRSVLQRIANLAQQRWLLVAKKRDILRNYIR